MARYTYNAGLVTQTIDTLYAACDCLDSTNVDIKKGIDMIYNARGAENMNIDFSPITGYQSQVVDAVENMAGEIKKKANEIEEYQDAPWYKKLFATIGMGALKLVEGLASFVENIGDGLVSIVGFIGGIFSSEFKNSVAEFVRTDYVGETTAKWYEEGWLKDVNKYSYMSHESTAANILKGVGTAAGYVILTVATAGAGGAVAAASTAISAGAAAVGGIGSGTQNALKQAQLANPEMSAGDAFNSAFGQGVKQGAIAAGTTLLTAGIAKGIQNMGAGGQFATFADKLDDATRLGKVAHGAQDLINKGANAINSTALGGKIIGGASKVLTGAGSYVDDAVMAIGTNPGVSNAVTNVAQNLVNAGGTALLANAAGSIAGASTQFKANTQTSEMDSYIRETSTPSVAEQLYTDTQEVLQSEEAKPGVATEEEAKQNLQDLQQQGYDPGSGSTPEPTPTPTIEETPNPTAGDVNPTPRPTGTSGGGPKPTVTAPEVTMPTPGPTNPQPTTPAPTQPQPTYTDPIVSNIDPVAPTPTPSSGNGKIPTGINDITGNTDVTKETVSSEVLNTFGEAAGSLSGLSGSKTSIPTSSSPILSSEDGSSKASSFVPLGAGLGAASLAGIGAKAVMDKREKASDEESDELETEEWATQDDVEIDYGMETSTEESDYLSPTDELAFTE